MDILSIVESFGASPLVFFSAVVLTVALIEKLKPYVRAFEWRISYFVLFFAFAIGALAQLIFAVGGGLTGQEAAGVLVAGLANWLVASGGYDLALNLLRKAVVK